MENGMVRTLTYGDREIVLVGTAHISSESIQEVKNRILGEKPDRVCIELDAGRLRTMTEKDAWASLDIVKVIKEGRVFLLMANLALSAFQRRMGSEVEVTPGQEMMAAIDTANGCGIPYLLCDRDVAMTLKRAWRVSNFWNKMKLISALLSAALSNEKMTEEQIEGLKDGNELEGMMSELSDYLPSVKRVLIDERDQYLAAKIWEGGSGRTLAVVGAGHLSGIETWFGKYSGGEKPEVTGLEFVPEPSKLADLAKWLVPVLLVAAIIAGFIFKGFDYTWKTVVLWVLLNGSLSAIGSAVSLAHPVTILVSFLSAPFATLNPLVSVGMFAGLTEAGLRKPIVADFENLSRDITTVRGFWTNKVTKILLVFILSSIGGVIGNFVAMPFFVKLFIK